MLALNLEQSNKQSNQRIQTLEANLDILTKSQLQVQNQLSQLTTVMTERQRGTLPRQPEPNPRGKVVNQIGTTSTSDQFNDHVNSITTLISSKKVDNKVELPTGSDSSSQKTSPSRVI
ncbi:hypothetical protein BVC80_791g6 [Macleaya cordata]|uniref:Uncharacterized protein n=1 Tax=Macleaya cordata TaxID=56857 RepID=A0A200QBI6_MACCD|nr:hypothetical protein BVC80_791g6 [Macleaya cordata]